MKRIQYYRVLFCLLAVTSGIGCAGASAVPSAGTGSAPAPPAQRLETQIVYAMPLAMDVRPTAALASSQPILPLIGSGLSTADGQGGRVPLLAAQIPSLDNGLWVLNDDGTMVTTFALRPGATWHDGTPITADDFVFSLAVGRDHRVPSFGTAAYASIADATAPDPHTLVIDWKEPYIGAAALFSWDQSYGAPLPHHLLEAAYTANPDGFLDLPYWNQEYVGSGPFKVVSWNTGVGMQLAAHDGYALGRPKIDRIDVQVITDANARIAGLLAGSIDATPVLPSLDAGLQLRDQWQGGTVLFDYGVGTWLALLPQFIDPSPAAMTDLRFRTALAVAIDRQALVDSLGNGMSPVPLSFLSPNQPQYATLEASLPRYEYDPQHAGQMLADLGYRRDTDGMLHDASGAALSVEVRSAVVGAADANARWAAAIADYWKQVGVDASPTSVPPALSSDNEYLATFTGFYVAPRPTDVNGLRGYTSAATPLASNNYAVSPPQNASRYMSADLDGLIDTYYRTIPIDERTAVMGRIAHMTADQLTMLGLQYVVASGARSNRLVGVGPQWSIQTFPWNAYAWEIQGA